MPRPQPAVGVEQRPDERRQHRRVERVEGPRDPGQRDAPLEALEQHVAPADAGGRVGVELEEPDVVVVKERVEPADPHGLREAGLETGERVLGRG